MGEYVKEAVRNPEIRDLYWAAGFLEGEGWFGMPNAKRKSQRTPRVQAAQTHEDAPLLRLQEIFGGSVYPMAKKEGYIQPNQWVVTGRRAATVMWALYSLLSLRRQRQIDKVLTVRFDVV